MENKKPSSEAAPQNHDAADHPVRHHAPGIGALGDLASSALGSQDEPVEIEEDSFNGVRPAPGYSRIALVPSVQPSLGNPVLMVSPQKRFETFVGKLNAIQIDPMGLYTDALHALCGNVVTMEGLWAAKALRLLFDKIHSLKSHEQKAYLFGSLYKAYAAHAYKSDQGYGNFTLHPEYAQLKADLQHVPETLLFEHRLIFWVNYLECALLAIDPQHELDKFFHQIQENLRPKLFGGKLNEMQRVTVMYTYGQMVAVMFYLAEQVQWPFEKIQRLLFDLPDELCRAYRIHLLSPDLGGKVASTRQVVDLERVSNILRGRHG